MVLLRRLPYLKYKYVGLRVSPGAVWDYVEIAIRKSYAGLREGRELATCRSV